MYIIYLSIYIYIYICVVSLKLLHYIGAPFGYMDPLGRLGASPWGFREEGKFCVGFRADGV